MLFHPLMVGEMMEDLVQILHQVLVVLAVVVQPH